MPNPFNPRRLPDPTRDMSQTSLDKLAQVDVALGARSTLDYRATLRTLKSIPKAERNLEWVERIVTLYAVTDNKLRRARSMTNRYGALARRTGTEEQFKAFMNRLNADIAPYRMTLHGKTLPFSARETAPILKDLQRLFHVLDENGYVAFINSGTLLGAVRESGFLPHDDDIDLAVLLEGKTPKDRNDALRKLGRLLDNSGISETPLRVSRAGPLVKLELPNEVGVDLFAFWLADDNAYIWPHTYGDLHRDDILPLSTATIEGVDFPAPKDAEKMLAINYGTEWRSPDSTFRFNWDVAKERFAEDLAVHRKAGRTLMKRIARKLKRPDRP